jgi:putative membrane protein
MKSSSIVLTCLTLITVALAPITSTYAADAKMCTADKSFFKKASQGGMTEVEAGKLAQEKGQSQDVKDFGARMVKDHTQNDTDLMALAKSKDVMVSDKLDSAHQAMIDKMSKMSDASFDKAYINGQVKGHEKMLTLMKNEESSSDPDMKDFATKTADVVQMHLDKAKEIQSSMK